MQQPQRLLRPTHLHQRQVQRRPRRRHPHLQILPNTLPTHRRRRRNLQLLRHPQLQRKLLPSIHVLPTSLFLHTSPPNTQRLQRRRRRRRPLRVRRELPPEHRARGGTLHRVVQQRVEVLEDDKDNRNEREERDGEGGGRV